MNNSFSDLVRRLNELSKEETTDDIVESAESTSIVEAKKDVEEDIVGDIRTRYSDFMKSETAQGNNLNTIEVAVKEATSSAMAIDDSFSKIFNMMNRLLTVTGENAVLSRMVEREGGDTAWIADAHQKLIEAMEAIENAHMYAVKQVEVD
jgi:predicted CopG family antitoxin